MEKQKSKRGKDKVVKNRRPRETGPATLKRFKLGCENRVGEKTKIGIRGLSKQLKMAVETRE